jgi:hypothetical protein
MPHRRLTAVAATADDGEVGDDLSETPAAVAKPTTHTHAWTREEHDNHREHMNTGAFWLCVLLACSILCFFPFYSYEFTERGHDDPTYVNTITS